MGRNVIVGLGSYSALLRQEGVIVQIEHSVQLYPFKSHLELLGEHLVEVIEDGLLDDLTVDGGDTVDRVGGDHCQVGHADKPKRQKRQQYIYFQALEHLA